MKSGGITRDVRYSVDVRLGVVPLTFSHRTLVRGWSSVPLQNEAELVRSPDGNEAWREQGALANALEATPISLVSIMDKLEVTYSMYVTPAF